ncbi:MAG: hypothetical protein IID61_03315 [SAR324 cluster bacterium]|nr:hypothetical protein [SAR324 cluster bacterium]
MTRCFVAFELAAASRQYLQERVVPVHDALRVKRRWPIRLVRPENWHATLLFFNDLSTQERDTVWQTVAMGARDGAWRGLAFDWRGLEPWPNRRRPSMISLVGEDHPQARSWPVAGLLQREPFSKADVRHYEPFRPHVTVMRFDVRWRKTLAADWAEVSETLAPIDKSRIVLDRAAFFLSTLSRDQPIYPRERTISLG